MAAVAAALAVLATGLAVPGRVALPMSPGSAGTGASRRLPVSLLAAVVTGGTCVALLDGTELALASIVLASCWGVLRILGRRRSARAADRRAHEVLAVCEAMASDLAAGQPPLLVLERAAQEWSELAPVSVAGQMGADVPAVLRELADRPGADQLRVLAATWQVAHETGAGLAGALTRAAETMRAERRTARLVSTELAAARATARMLALLPVGVLAVGAGVGGDPVGFLTGSPIGLGILGAGVGLCFAGLRWLDHIADSVLRR